jgi:predicted PurR-regulated permease PerM
MLVNQQISTSEELTGESTGGENMLPHRDKEPIPENQAADSAAVVVRANRYLRMNVSLGLLATISFVAALYLGRDFIVPLLIGILASYTLTPLVDWLKKCYVPRPLGAALVLGTLIGSLVWIVFALNDDAAALIERLPETARQFRQNLRETRTSPSSLQSITEAAHQLEGAAADAGAKPGTPAVTPKPAEPTEWLSDYVLAQSTPAIILTGQAVIVLVLTYFLLSAGPHFRRKLVGFVGPSLARQKDAVRILDEISLQIQLYLLTMLVSNVLIGIGTWLAFRALGMEQAGVWGVISCILSFIPYLGPASVALASGMAAFLQFGSIFTSLAVTGVSLLVTGVVGLLFMPWLQSKFAHVNAAVLFIALLLFGWLWGAWGLLLGAPLVAIVKVICDRVESLKPIGELLGR